MILTPGRARQANRGGEEAAKAEGRRRDEMEGGPGPPPWLGARCAESGHCGARRLDPRLAGCACLPGRASQEVRRRWRQRPARSEGEREHAGKWRGRSEEDKAVGWETTGKRVNAAERGGGT